MYQHGPIVAAQEQEDDVLTTETNSGVAPELFYEFDLERVAISDLAIATAGSPSERTHRIIHDKKSVRPFVPVPTACPKDSSIVTMSRLFRNPRVVFRDAARWI